MGSKTRRDGRRSLFGHHIVDSRMYGHVASRSYDRTFADTAPAGHDAYVQAARRRLHSLHDASVWYRPTCRSCRHGEFGRRGHVQGPLADRVQSVHQQAQEADSGCAAQRGEPRPQAQKEACQDHVFARLGHDVDYTEDGQVWLLRGKNTSGEDDDMRFECSSQMCNASKRVQTRENGIFVTYRGPHSHDVPLIAPRSWESGAASEENSGSHGSLHDVLKLLADEGEI